MQNGTYLLRSITKHLKAAKSTSPRGGGKHTQRARLHEGSVGVLTEWEAVALHVLSNAFVAQVTARAPGDEIFFGLSIDHGEQGCPC